MNKSKWKPIHHRIHREKRAIDSRLRNLRERFSEAERQFEEQRKALYKELKQVENKCPHIDNGSMFISTCDVCGWADYYDGG